MFAELDQDWQGTMERRIWSQAEHDLREAIENDHLVLDYFPKVDLGPGESRWVEALVRWKRPGQGTICPLDFLPSLQQTGIDRHLALWVLIDAMHQWHVWREANLDLHVAINLSLASLTDPQLAERLVELLKMWDADPFWFRFEVAQDTLATDDARMRVSLRRMHEIGFSIAVDHVTDETLGGVEGIAIDEVKIDQSLIVNIPHDTGTAATVQAIIAAAHDRGAAVTAVGVSSREAIKVLGVWTCDAVQGNYVCPPIAAGDVPASLHFHASRLSGAS
jgi:EAL domain-containing protein (putative c-di-GMP-specific phosphodiesterase class I)